ncbi:hypothetical protein CR513_23680, partial [Mucuna pruriens]
MLTPIHPTSILILDKTDKKVDQTLYKGMINFLLYLTTFTPDIMFSVLLILVCAIKNMINIE